MNQNLGKICTAHPWSQPGTVRHRGLFYKYAEHLWDYASTSKLCILGVSIHTLRILPPPGVSGNHSPLGKKKGLTMRFGHWTGKEREIQMWLEWTTQQDDSPQACRAVVPKERTSKRELGGISDATETWPFNGLATGPSGPQQTTIPYKFRITRPNPGCQRPCP